jgi:hypothetical protein
MGAQVGTPGTNGDVMVIIGDHDVWNRAVTIVASSASAPIVSFELLDWQQCTLVQFCQTFESPFDHLWSDKLCTA